MAVCAFVSFRLGLDDGVSIVADTWQGIVRGLGHDVVSVAGEGPVDRLVPELAIGATTAPSRGSIERALDGVDLVVVENLLTIPLRPDASEVVADVLAGRPAILHHHDPPWQRTRFRHLDDFVPNDPAWFHVTINQRTVAEFAERDITATRIYNGFDLDPPRGDRHRARRRIGLGDERTVVHPVRAIQRKNIPAAIALAEALDATYWLTGPAEEGYDDRLAELLASARCPVVHAPLDNRSDLYAAADMVVFPSIWEGFGNPPVEAAIHRRPVAVGDYPIASELRSLGFDWLRPDEIDELRRELVAPDLERLDHNRSIAEANFGRTATADCVERLLERAGLRHE